MHAVTLYQLHAGRAFALLGAAIGLCVLLYIGLMFGTVAQASAQTAAEEALAALRSEIGVLEGRYLAEQKTLSPERAQALGFVRPAASAVVYTHTPAGLTVR